MSHFLRTVRTLPSPSFIGAALLGASLALPAIGADDGPKAPTPRAPTVSPPSERHPTRAVRSIATRPAVVPEREVSALLGWARHLSNHDGPVSVPPVRLESSAFFARHACRGGHRCRVLGWYADRGVVHVHEDLAGLDTLFARSLVVHELVHYLQHVSGRFAAHDCASFVAREREAYAVQQRFFMAYGALPTIRPHHFACPETDGTDTLVRTSGR